MERGEAFCILYSHYHHMCNLGIIVNFKMSILVCICVREFCIAFYTCIKSLGPDLFRIGEISNQSTVKPFLLLCCFCVSFVYFVLAVFRVYPSCQ